MKSLAAAMNQTKRKTTLNSKQNHLKRYEDRHGDADTLSMKQKHDRFQPLWMIPLESDYAEWTDGVESGVVKSI